MSKRRKLVLALFVLGLSIFLAPIVYSGVGTHGYFEGYRCACGFQNYYFIESNALWTFSPGHGRIDRLFSLREHDGIWDARKDDGELIVQLRFANGALLEKSSSRTQWRPHPRIYNIWGVWIERLLAKEDDLGEPLTVPVNHK